MPLVDSVRGLAAVGVLAVHTAFISGAAFSSWYRNILVHLNIALTVFFVLSGFLLYRPWVAARAEGRPGPGVMTYGKRRLLRIYPAYWAALVVLSIYPGLYGVFSKGGWSYWVLLQNYPIHQIGAECTAHVEGCGLPQTWSLSVEIGFYALLPLYALLMDRVGRKNDRRAAVRRELLVLAGVSTASIIVQVWAVAHGDGYGWLAQSVFGMFFWFAIGMALAVLKVDPPQNERLTRARQFVADQPGLLWAAALGLLLALSYWVLPLSSAAQNFTVTQHVAEQIGFGLVSLLFVLPAIVGDDAGGIPRRILANRGIRWLGRISFGIFLWHLTVGFWLGSGGAWSQLPGSRFVNLFLLTLGITVIPACLSFCLIERPLMRFGHRPRKRSVEANEP